jgi:diadenosine tetraphosphatase ApaH/serine/threonine PP2A family protein phosphatase
VRYLVLTDLHANLHALDAVLADAQAIGYEQVLVLGDLVGYGGDPGPVIDRTLALEPVAIIRGNHDKVCAGLEPATLFNDVARRSIEWTASVLTPAQMQILAELPKGPKLVTPELEICHGTPFDEDHYVFDGDDAAQAIDAASARICLFGHTHLPAVYTTSDDQAASGADLQEDELRLPKAGPALINVGSVGQPRDGDARAAYGLLDTEKKTIRMRRVTYDLQGAQKKILDAGLPAWLAMRLERGQ